MLKRTIALTVALSAAGLGVGPVSAQAQADVRRVAVLDFNSFMMGQGGGSVSLGKAISAMLITEFSGREGLLVIERQQLNALLDEQDLDLSGRVVESQAVQIGKLLGVEFVLLGQVTSIVDNLRMDIRAVDVETSEILIVLKKSDKTSELLDVVVSLADDFGRELSLTPRSQQEAMESIPVAATVEFSRALDLEDRGDIAGAIARYEATLEIHANHRDARLALERLRRT
jgi:curli biogenesis system outer membrane secretion channel CsgG